MHTYETMFITPPNLTEEEEAEAVSTLAKIVDDGGGQFTVNERMGRRRLAYPIMNFNDGVYTRFLYDAVPAVPTELERRIRISDKVLRVLTVRLDGQIADKAKKQAIEDMQARAEAAERERLEAIEREKAEAEAAAAAPAAPPSEDAAPAGGETTGTESAGDGEA